MTTAEWITASLVFIIVAILAVVSIRSFQNKGFLFNNAYIYASIVWHQVKIMYPELPAPKKRKK